MFSNSSTAVVHNYNQPAATTCGPQDLPYNYYNLNNNNNSGAHHQYDLQPYQAPRLSPMATPDATPPRQYDDPTHLAIPPHMNMPPALAPATLLPPSVSLNTTATNSTCNNICPGGEVVASLPAPRAKLPRSVPLYRPDMSAVVHVSITSLRTYGHVVGNQVYLEALELNKTSHRNQSNSGGGKNSSNQQQQQQQQ
eukprot:PhM_4_TR11664/c2_g3_i1/m.64187